MRPPQIRVLCLFLRYERDEYQRFQSGVKVEPFRHEIVLQSGGFQYRKSLTIWWAYRRPTSVAHRLLSFPGDGILMLPLQALGGLLGTQIGQLLVALVVIAVVVLVGRFVLNVAWKLVLVATVIVGAIWLASTFLGGF